MIAPVPVHCFSLTFIIIYGDLVYKFKKIRGMTDFSDQFRKNIMRYKRIGYNLNPCDSLHAKLLTQSRLMAMLHSLIARRWIGRHPPCWPRPKAIYFSWLGPERSSVAWSTGAQLIIFFCFRYLVVLFDRPEISIRHAAHCICRVLLVFASS